MRSSNPRIPAMHRGPEIIVADITTLDVDAIVNAANTTLLGGGGVDGAIHRAAGPGLLEACRAIGGCNTGEAVVTGGFDLPASRVIHTVGPIYGGDQRDATLLASCYRASLALAAESGIASIAFPCISTGAYGYPPRDAAAIALREIRAWLDADRTPHRIIVCCFSDADAGTYRDLLTCETES